MRLPFILSLATCITAVVGDLNPSQLDVVTRVVQDAQQRRGKYINFFTTYEGQIPPEVTSFANDVTTYTDDSYTTMFDNGGIRYDVFESVATELPWYRWIGNRNRSKNTSLSNVSSSTSVESSSTSVESSSTSIEPSSTSNLAGSAYIPIGATFFGLIAIVL